MPTPAPPASTQADTQTNAPTDTAPDALFAYGTLCFAEVMRRMGGRVPAGERAVLPGHRCRLLCGEPFPAVVPDPGEDTPGILYRGVDRELLARLDQYEGEWYQRAIRRVHLATGTAPAWVYLLAPGHAHRLSTLPWRPEVFRRRFLPALLASCPAEEKSRRCRK